MPIRNNWCTPSYDPLFLKLTALSKGFTLHHLDNRD